MAGQDGTEAVPAVRIAVALYAVTAWLLPDGFRERHGPPARRLFGHLAREAWAAGALALVRLTFATLLDLLAVALRERLPSRRSARRMARRHRGMDDPRPPTWSTKMNEWRQDVRYGLRVLRRTPGFGLVVVLTLALGIGANTALFSVVRAVLLEPLPYGEPARLAMIWSAWPGFDKTWVSEPEFLGYQEQVRSFEELALFNQFELSVTDSETPERMTAAAFTTNFLDVIGVEPALGRGFRPEEAQDSIISVVMLSFEAWQRRYGGDPAVIGRTLNVNGIDREIVGVLPAGFRLPIDFATDRPTQIWLPYAIQTPPGPVPFAGGSHGSYVVGRLRQGVTAAAANAELRAYTARLTEAGSYPPEWNFTATAVPVEDEVAGGMKPALYVLLGAVGLVLLIACVNVANLLLVRGEDRRREMAVRTALGAGRARMVRQLLAENAVLAFAGGALALAVAGAGIALLRALAPAELPRIAETAMDGGVLAFTFGLCVLTALLFGLLPALNGARADVQAALREGGRANTAGTARTRMRRTLVAGEVALAVVLAAGAGLMLRSFWRLVQIDPGFNAEQVLTMRLAVPSAFYPEEADVQRFYTELLTRIRALPGVASAGLIRVLPIDQTIGDSCVQVVGFTPPPGQCAPADWQAASEGYFEAMGMELVAGRFIEERDSRDAPQSIVVNEAFVRAYLPDAEPIGHRVQFAFNPAFPDQAIVGVVGDARHNGITGEIKPTFYRPHAQWAVSTGSPQRSMALVVRSTTDALALAPQVRRHVRDLDPRLPVSSVQTMAQVMSRAVAQPRFTLVLLLAFGGLAITLAVVGVYGVVSYTVAARRQELGIRMALGAAPGAVVWLSLRHGLTCALAGVAAGTLTALAATRVMSTIVYDVPTTDPLTYGAIALLGVVVAVGASWIPARRAARTDPLEALRAE